MKSDKALVLYAVFSQYVGIFVLFKILAVSLESHEFSEYMLFTAASNLVLGLPFTAIQQALLRYIPGTNDFFASAVLASAIKLSLYCSAFYFLLLLVLYQIVYTNGLIKTYQLDFVLCFCVSELLKLYVLAFENSLQKRMSYFLFVVIEYFLKILLVSLLIVSHHSSASNIFVALIIANLLVVCFWSVVSKFDWKLVYMTPLSDSRVASQILLFSAPVAAWSIFGWMRDMSGRYIVEVLLTKENVSAFAVLGTITAFIPGLVQNLVATYAVPKMYADHNSKKKPIEESINLVLVLMLGISVFSTVFVFLFANLFVSVISSSKYLFVSEYLPFTIFAYFIYATSMVATTELYAKGKVNLLFIPNVISGIVGFFSIYQLTLMKGFGGAVSGFVIGYISYAIAVLCLIIFYRFNSDLDLS